jgi:hypothetical protein
MLLNDVSDRVDVEAGLALTFFEFGQENLRGWRR